MTIKELQRKINSEAMDLVGFQFEVYDAATGESFPIDKIEVRVGEKRAVIVINGGDAVED